MKEKRKSSFAGYFVRQRRILYHVLSFYFFLAVEVALVVAAFFTASALGAAAFLAVVFFSVVALAAVFFAVAIIFSFVDLHKTSGSLQCRTIQSDVELRIARNTNLLHAKNLSFL